MNVKKRKVEMSARGPEGERYYRLALMGCGEPVLGVRVDGQGEPQPFWLVNGAARQLLGYSAQAWSRLSLLSLGLSRAEVRQLLQSGCLYGSVVTAGGQVLPLTLQARPLAEGYFVVTLQPGGGDAERDLAVLAQAAAALGRAESWAAIAEAMETAVRALWPRGQAAWLWPDRPEETRFLGEPGWSEALVRAIADWRRQGKGEPVFWPEVARVPTVLQTHFRQEAVGAIALFPWGEGELAVYYEEPHPFCERERRLGEVLAGLVGGAIARQEAAAAQTRRNHFLAMAAHELRTPIGAILSNANILEYACDRDNPKATRALQRLQRSLQELLGVLDDVLAIGRLDAGTLEFQPRWLDLRELCAHRLEEWHLTREEARRVVFACAAERVPFYGDAKLLRHLLDNLIANGLKYSPPERPVEVTLTATPQQIAIAVRDYGIGIAEADRARLFEPFFRGQNVGSVSGSGLGLAIVKRYADLHGARLSCESHLGEGSTFRVEFPVTPRPEPERVESLAKT